MKELKDRVYELYDNNHNLTLDQYNNLIKDCVEKKEMAAVVFIYDTMKEKKINPSDTTFKLLNKLHSKTIKESNEIYIKNQNIGKLNPRRRIHKIMKGYNYSDNYNNALIHLDKVKKYIESNPNIKEYSRIKLAKTLSKNCSISFNDARYIITNLKRTKYLRNTPKQIDNFSKISEIHKQSKIESTHQTSITQFFKKS